MDRITIEKAADVYADKAPESYCNGDYGKYAISDAFEEGAKWRINSVWHDMSEKPNGLFVILADFGNEEEYSLGITLDGIESAKRWAYVDDLLPDGKEADNG